MDTHHDDDYACCGAVAVVALVFVSLPPFYVMWCLFLDTTPGHFIASSMDCA